METIQDQTDNNVFMINNINSRQDLEDLVQWLFDESKPEFMVVVINNFRYIFKTKSERYKFTLGFQAMLEYGKLLVEKEVNFKEEEKEVAVEDSNIRWCEEHVDILRQYPNEFVAINVEQGTVVAHSQSDEDFGKLRDLGDEMCEKLFTTHTSRYL